jgi:hypothetical protein
LQNKFIKEEESKGYLFLGLPILFFAFLAFSIVFSKSIRHLLRFMNDPSFVYEQATPEVFTKQEIKPFKTV